MEDEPNRLANVLPGTNVNIKRTDGRVHSALISSINTDNESVTVEWFEKGETKGKEIEIETLLILNPELQVLKRPNQIIKDEIIHSPKLTRQESSSSSEDASMGGMRYSHHKLSSDLDADVNSNQHSSYTMNASQTSLPIPSKGAKSTGPLRSIRNGKDARITTFMPSNGYNDHENVIINRRLPEPVAPATRNVPPSSQISTATIVTRSETNHQINSGVGVSVGGGIGAAKSRRSNVVKEVEKLKKNREERRQRQAEEKAEKEAFLNQAPGNPHWEFLNMVQEYRSQIDFKPITINDLVEDHQITVCVRKRPLNKKEMARKEVDVISVPTKDTVIVHEPKNKVDLTKYLENQCFRFDYAFDETCTNELVYKFTAQPLVATIFEGGMATCFAYGQTGSGKTHTMGGDFHGKTQDCNKGIYALVAKDVFSYLRSKRYGHSDYVVAASFFEIYSGKVFDLLNGKARLRILEDGKQQVQVVGLTERVVSSTEEVLKIIQLGNNARTSGQTSANSNSSRSHAVFQITLRPPGVAKIHGKFSLIDLAGNERGADTSSSNRTTRMEGAEINKSLLALKECIRALGKKGQSHLPFRASKLTQVLRDSFIGEKSRTCMIAMISPNVASCEHSLNTLRYADRVKELAVNDPEIKDEQRGENDYNCDEQEDADLLALKSMNESEMPDNMLHFHKMMQELQAAEEAMVENHKSMNDYLEQMISSSQQLYTSCNNVDYDQDAYSQDLEELLEHTIDKLKTTQILVQEFRGKLYAEEQLSRSMKS